MPGYGDPEDARCARAVSIVARLQLDDAAARRAIEQAADESGLPVTDVVRYGVAPLLDAIL